MQGNRIYNHPLRIQFEIAIGIEIERKCPLRAISNYCEFIKVSLIRICNKQIDPDFDINPDFDASSMGDFWVHPPCGGGAILNEYHLPGIADPACFRVGLTLYTKMCTVRS